MQYSTQPLKVHAAPDKPHVACISQKLIDENDWVLTETSLNSGE